MKRSTILTVMFVLLILISIMSPGVYGWGQDTAEEINAIYKKGIQAYQDKNYTGYLESFETLNRLLPGHRIVMANLARAYALNGKPDDAIKYLKNLIPIDADPKIVENSDFDSLRGTDVFKDIVKAFELARAPISCSRVAFTIKERDLHPESIAYDPVKKTFYLSSVHKRKIVYVDKNGTLKDFILQGQDGIDSVLGIRIDPVKRILWASSCASPRMIGYNEKDKGRTGVFTYSLDTKKLIKKYEIQGQGEEEHEFDDLVIHPGGDVYLSDAIGIYRIPAQTDRLEPFMNSPEFQSTQGIDFCGKGKKLLVADYVKGLYLVDMETGKVQAKIEASPDISLIGIDGLYYVEETNSVIAVQNGINPMRVAQYFLTPDFCRVRDYKIIERANPMFNEPTLGVVVSPGEFYYIANSQWNGYDKDMKILPLDKLQDIVILKAVLSDSP